MNSGKNIVTARRVTLSLVLVAVLASLAFDTGFGTPSAFGIGEFFLLCPLGGIEAMLASKSFLPVAAISLAVVLVFSLIFGRAWCAWGCPAPTIRRFFKREPQKDLAAENAASDAARTEREACGSGNAAQRKDDVSAACSSCANNKQQDRTDSSVDNKQSQTKGASSCADRRQTQTSLKEILAHYIHDKRVWVLAGVLIITFAVGIPLFCLICPIGLTFGTVSSLWHLIVDKQVTASVIVFPLCLAIELVVYRKWCINLCPIGGLLGIVGHFAKLFRPRIDSSTCLRYNSSSECNKCAHVCPENINMHTAEAIQTLANCTRCGECLKTCPTSSISIKAKRERPLV